MSSDTKQATLILLVFSLMNFAIEMTASVFNGILDKIAISLNVTLAQAGLLNSMYFYGAAFGVPITLIVFRRMERTKLLKIMLLLTILLTSVLIFAQSFGQLLIIRLILGIAANGYGVLAIATVASLSSKERQGRSLALYVAGAAVAHVVGVPLTRAVLSTFDWRTIFWIMDFIMVLSLVYFHLYLPEDENASTKLDLIRELSQFKDGKGLAVIAYTLIIFVGYGAFLNYITPYLVLLYPSFEPVMSVILVGVGLAGFTGNFMGGHIGDKIGSKRSMLLGAAVQIILTVLVVVLQPFRWLALLLVILSVTNSWFTGLQVYTRMAELTHNSSFMTSVTCLACLVVQGKVPAQSYAQSG